MPKCENHPRNESFYWDSLHKFSLCFDCVWDWIGNNRMSMKEDPGRITHSTLGFIDVGNINSGKDFREKYDCVINVSDTMTGHEDYWFPINELSAWGYPPFFWFKKIMDKQKGKRVLVHCAAGIHRSAMMAFCWLLSIGFCESKICEMLDNKHLCDDYNNDIKNGHIPNDLKDFYRVIDEHPQWSLAGVLRELGIPNLLNNTSLRDNTKYQDYEKKTL